MAGDIDLTRLRKLPADQDTYLRDRNMTVYLRGLTPAELAAHLGRVMAELSARALPGTLHLSRAISLLESVEAGP